MVDERVQDKRKRSYCMAKAGTPGKYKREIIRIFAANVELI